MEREKKSIGTWSQQEAWKKWNGGGVAFGVLGLFVLVLVGFVGVVFFFLFGFVVGCWIFVVC